MHCQAFPLGPKQARSWTRVFSLVVLAIFVCLVPAFGQEVRIYVSSQAGDRITPKSPLRFEPRTESKHLVFRINDAVRYQTIAGFGASFLEAGMICLHSLAPAEQESVLRALFDPERGTGFSAMKTVIAGTDFMSAGPWYTYDETPGDVEMKHFTIARVWNFVVGSRDDP